MVFLQLRNLFRSVQQKQNIQ